MVFILDKMASRKAAESTKKRGQGFKLAAKETAFLNVDPHILNYTA